MVSGLDCVPAEELRAFLLGELPERVGRRVATHLENCPACDAEAGRLDVETDPLIRSLRRALRPEAEHPTGTDAGTFPPAAEEDPGAPVRVAGYEILGELGRGGMGVVYKARQPGLNRIVALKMILAAEHAGPERRARFKAEGEAVARLSHPNIVQVYEVGEHQGLPFVCLEFVDGPSLGRWLGGVPQPPRQAAALVETLARAVQHAHEAGVVHRDLKPANVLLALRTPGQNVAPPAARKGGAELPQSYSPSPAGQMENPPGETGNWEERFCPKVADFGLAKQAGTELTATGVILGTPSYMAPEQAASDSRAVGPACDVWALGAILYEMLTGRPPFKAGSALETLEQVRTQEPVPPRRLVAKCPRDLETICIKCLHKDPRHRYASARELAEDLSRYGAGRPVVARPLGPVGRLWRWGRRNPLLAGATGMVVASLVGVAVVSAVSALNLEREGRKKTEALQDKETALRAEKEAVQKARQEQSRAQRRLAESYLERGLESCTTGADVALGLLWMVRALEATPADAADLDWAIRMNLVAWGNQVWRLRQALRLPGKSLWSLSFTPRATALLSEPASEPERRWPQVWDVSAHRPLGPPPRGLTTFRWTVLSPDGRMLLTWVNDRKKYTGEARLWSVATGEPLGVPVLHPAHILKGMFSPDSSTVFTADFSGTVRATSVGGTTSGKPVRLAGRLVEFSPDGRLALTSSGKTVRLCSVASGQPVGDPLPTAAVERCAFSPDGKSLLTATFFDPLKNSGGEARLWATDTGRPLCPPLLHPTSIQQVAFGVNRRDFLTLSGNRAQIWRAGRPLRGPFSHPGGSRAVFGGLEPSPVAAFGRDGRTLLLALGTTARLWDIPNGRPGSTLLRHRGNIHALCFGPDGQILTGANEFRDGWTTEVRLWSRGPGLPLLRSFPHNMLVHAAISPDGRFAVTAAHDRSVRQWDALTGKPLATLPPQAARTTVLAFSADSRVVLFCAGGVFLWPVGAPRPTLRLQGHGVSTTAALSPDGRTIATAGADTVARLWEAATGTERATLRGHTGFVTQVLFSPDGRFVLTGSGDRTARLWEAATGKPVGGPLRHETPLVVIAFSPDSRRALTGSYDGAVRLWEAATGQPLAGPLRAGPGLRCVAFSPDGKTLASAGIDGAVRLWDEQGRPQGTPLRQQGTVTNVTFSADGKLLLTDNVTEGNWLWAAETGWPIGPPLPGQQIYFQAATFGAGRRIFTYGGASAYLWPVPEPVKGPPPKVKLWVQALTGLELDRHGVVTLLDEAAWQDCRRRLKGLGGSP